MLLTQTTTPEDVKALNRAELPQLCDEIRHAILESSAAVGGHVAPNLGVVELTVALHRVFNSPIDKILFDVSHQTYTHKALTGRAYTYIDPKRFGEASGFANPDESEHDLFAMGHTSTSVSLGCGLAHARDLAGDAYNVITIIGDGSLSGGLAFEGFNNAAELDSNLIIIVNDNDQSIAENHGGLYRNLAELRASNGTCERNVFRAMGLDYRYLDAGNDVLALVDALQELRNIDHPIVLHVSTAKGKGFAGTIKRWGFKSYRRTHGSHKNERRPGSVGACATPSRILKGKRMAGRMGHVTATVQSLTVMSADAENNVLAIKGAIPGPKGGIVLVRTAVKGA